jgi:hypothetical protein
MRMDWELAICLQSEHDADSFLLYEQDAATCNFS